MLNMVFIVLNLTGVLIKRLSANLSSVTFGFIIRSSQLTLKNYFSIGKIYYINLQILRMLVKYFDISIAGIKAGACNIAPSKRLLCFNVRR